MLATAEDQLSNIVRFAARPTSLAGRRFLLVSMPFGPFGKTLARTLKERGARAERLLVNTGDYFDWGPNDTVVYQGAAEDWPARLEAIVGDYTDLVVFGEGGAYNQAVLAGAERFAARVWVLENGYFRPDWITVERNGVNARTRLPRTPMGYVSPIEDPQDTRHAGIVLPHHVANLSRYHFLQFLLGWLLFPRYQRPYRQPAWLQCVGHIVRYFRLAVTPGSANDEARIAARGPFFIACLQREGDVQLTRYSPFKDNSTFLETVMQSFAKHAPASSRLVVKNHPLDPGLVNLTRQTHEIARKHGLEGRVDFIDGGHLARLCRASQGMVVNNSSAALSALGFGTPVKALGDAFFDFAGLTDQKSLDAFWRAPAAADQALFHRFRAHVIHQSQVNGNYHEPAALDFTANGVCDAFETRAAG